MRSTVGPLPSAVYWRRRAVVLGALLLGVIVLFVSCSGGDDPKRGQGTSASQYPTPAPATATRSASAGPDDLPSFVDGQPGGGISLPDPGDVDKSAAAPGASAPGVAAPDNGTGTAGANQNVNAPAGGACTDAEVSVVPVPATTSIKRGQPLDIHLKIKNVGTRTCNRDLGALAQELYIDQGVQKIWSSDTCSDANQSDVKTISPGIERDFVVTWNGHTATKCQGALAAGPVPPAGIYQLRGRLSTKISDPVALAVVA